LVLPGYADIRICFNNNSLEQNAISVFTFYDLLSA